MPGLRRTEAELTSAAPRRFRSGGPLESVSGFADSAGFPVHHQRCSAWATAGAAIDAFVTVNGEGNHKGCPYAEIVFSRNVARWELDRSL